MAERCPLVRSRHIGAERSRPTPRAIHAASLAAACTAMAAAPAWAQLTVGPNVNISKQSGNQAEGAIAINPTNPQNIFALYNNLGAGNGMFGAVSTNGGATWVPRAVGTGADGLTASLGDPSVSYDNFGNLFLCHLTSSALTQVGLSTNSGASFSTLFTFAGSTDQPTITAWGGSSWVTFNQSSGVRVSGASVSGLGVVGAWSPLALAPSSNTGISGSFGDIAIGPGGRMAVAYQNSGSGQGPDTIYTNFDPDGLGAAPMGARLVLSATNIGGFDFIPAQPSRSIDAEVGLGYDRTGGQFNGRLYAVYNDEPVNENNDTNILVRISDTNGTTWSAAVKVNDDATTRSQFLPKIAVDPITGHIAIAWYDSRNSAANNQVQIYATASMDGGATWSPNIRVSTGLSNLVSGGFDWGDYIGLSIHNDVFYPLWADSSNSTGDNPNGTTAQDMYTARVSICYANCDGSSVAPILNANDFACFLTKFAAADPYANCDNSSVAPILNANDFACFLTKFAGGCP